MSRAGTSLVPSPTRRRRPKPWLHSSRTIPHRPRSLPSRSSTSTAALLDPVWPRSSFRLNQKSPRSEAGGLLELGEGLVDVGSQAVDVRERGPVGGEADAHLAGHRVHG